MIMRYHPKIGYLFVPNQKARLENEKGGFYVVTNASGFRSDFDFQKTKNKKPRVLMFGDSYTAGDNCSNRDRFSDKLAETLGAEVYNYGISGSGTDQHLLAYREFAKDVEADLVVVCVQVDSILRVQAKSRKSIDRATGQYVMVPKPYFTLDNGKLALHNVPVPRERQFLDGDDSDKAGVVGKLRDFYRHNASAAPVRKLVRQGIKTLRKSAQPYPDYQDCDSQGWTLMEAILKQFAAEVAPLPLLIAPIPSREYYVQGLDPIYQPLFESIEAPSKRVFVMDATAPLTAVPVDERESLTFKVGGHFSSKAHNIVANAMADFITRKELLPSTQDTAQWASSASPPFKRPSEKYVLGLSCFYHNSAACLLKDGQIVAAAEEERFTRIKNDRRFPAQAVNYCLEEAGIDTEHLDAVAYYDNASLTFERIIHSLISAEPHSAEKMWMRMLPPWLQYKLHIPSLIKKHLHYDGLILQGNHHRSHAASAFFPSPFESAAILTIDGVGEWGTASIGHGNDGELKILKEMRFPNSLGLLYSAFTEFTGFKVNSGEYKMMGLAPYGNPVYKQAILDNLVDLKEDGSLELNMDYFAFLDDLKMTNSKFADLFGGPAREQESRITRREMDIAKSIQAVTEEAILRMARTAHKLTGENKLCLAGGVALNCVANGRLLREGPFDDLWIQPAAGDSGCALGVAFDVWHEYFANPRELRGDGLPHQMGSYWGPSFSDNEIKAYLDTHGFPYKQVDDKEKSRILADAINDGKIVGYFNGRLEYGPRALGGRSIIGDPRNSETQVDMNLKIKYRESFRPFAPSVLEEDVEKYFEMKGASPYMLLVAPVKKERRRPFELPKDMDDMLPVVRQPRSDIPAITHVDFSARVQTVSEAFAPAYHNLIKTFREKTGCGVIVNTSFNVRGEPIVCTPVDAYRCFMRTEMNMLALGNFILFKEEQPEWPEGKGDGLESAENDTDPNAFYNQDFLTSLKDYFKTGFNPLAAAIREDVSIPRAPLGETSAWVDVVEPANLRDIFTFAPASLEEDAAPEALADAIVASWQKREETDKLKTLTCDLLEIAMKHPVALDFNEEVPETVYAMF